MLIRHIDDAYEIYWNGKLVSRFGTMPPNPSYLWSPPPQTFGLGPIRDGVLALRVWKAPLNSFDTDQLGGLMLHRSSESQVRLPLSRRNRITRGCAAASICSD